MEDGIEQSLSPLNLQFFGEKDIFRLLRATPPVKLHVRSPQPFWTDDGWCAAICQAGNENVQPHNLCGPTGSRPRLA